MERRRFVELAAASAAYGLVDQHQAPIALGEREGQGQSAERETIFAYIDRALPRHIELIQAYVRQKSVSASGEGITEGAALTRDYLLAAGCKEVQIVPTRGHPGVWGVLDVGAPRTLVVFWMYDTSPANPEEWSSPPFEARIVADSRFGQRGRILRGRGSLDAKGANGPSSTRWKPYGRCVVHCP